MNRRYLHKKRSKNVINLAKDKIRHKSGKRSKYVINLANDKIRHKFV